MEGTGRDGRPASVERIRRGEGSSGRMLPSGNTYINIRGLQLDRRAEYVKPLAKASKLPHIPQTAQLWGHFVCAGDSRGPIIKGALPSRCHGTPVRERAEYVLRLLVCEARSFAIVRQHTSRS